MSLEKVSSWSSELTPPASTRPTGMRCAACCGSVPWFAATSACLLSNPPRTNPWSFSNASWFASRSTPSMCASVSRQHRRYASRRASMPSCVSSGTSGKKLLRAVTRLLTAGALRSTKTPWDTESANAWSPLGSDDVHPPAPLRDDIASETCRGPTSARARRCVRPVAACLGAGRTERRGEPRDEGRRHAKARFVFAFRHFEHIGSSSSRHLRKGAKHERSEFLRRRCTRSTKALL